jgi:hypothetical protein
MAEGPVRGVARAMAQYRASNLQATRSVAFAARLRVATAAVRLEYDGGLPSPPEGHVVDFNKLIARVKNILLTPKAEWPVIAARIRM